MGNCTSLFNASSGKANIQDPVKNHPAKPLSTDVPIQNGRLDPPPKPEGVDPVLEENIRKGLRLLMKKSSDRENSNIILPEELARFWTTAKRRFYNRQSWYDPIWDEEDEMTKFQTIISVLILARFNNWGNFRRVFIDQQERLDENLPFKSEDLKNENFLGPDFAPNFYDCQWIFCPLVIEERQEPYELLGMEAERRFPYIKPGKEIGSGATGVVSKQVIAARHLKYSALGRKSDNTENKTIACKQVIEGSVKPVEFENLKSLRGCLSQHSRIMVNIATIIQNLPNGVKVHLILYDLAAYDLHTFLNKRPESHEEERLRRHDSGPSKRNNSHDWWAGDLIQESMNLADALDYLHDRLYSGRNLSLVHNDLKPENILVFYHDSINQDERYPVGQWKIADFGLAKMKKKRETQLVEKQSAPRVTKSPHPAVLGADNLLLDITHRRTRSISARDISITTAKRDPGRYTAPEIEAEGKCQQHPKSGDVWAFGCILSEVLAYAIAPHLVAELREECEKPRLQDQRFYDVETRKVKPTVLAWLQDLPNRYQAHPITPREGQTVKSPSWVAGCVELIQSVLEAEPAKRDSAGLIRDRLNKIEEQMSREAKFTLTDRVASTNSSASARDSQSEDTQWLCAPSGSPKSIKFPKIPHIGEVTEHGPNRGTKS